MSTATMYVHPTTFYSDARELEKMGASQEEWDKLRERLLSYAMQHIDSFTRLGLDAALTVMRRYLKWELGPLTSTPLALSFASIECAAWNMAWLCLVRIADEENKEKRPYYLRKLCYSLLVANTFAS